MSAIDKIVNEQSDTLIQHLFSDKNSVLRKTIEEKLIDNHESSLKTKESKKMIHIGAKLNDEEKIILQDNYPEFNIVFNDTENIGHGFANASRILETEVILRSLRYDNCEKFMDTFGKYDYYLNDIGANSATNILKGRKYIHNCEPIISLYDSTRKTQKICNLMMTDPEKLSSNTIEILKPENLKKIRCNDTFQKCKFTSPFGMCIHSNYDIDLQDLVNGMDKKNMFILYGTFIFHPEILIKNKGFIKGINCDYEMDERKKIIKFFFKNDTSFGYMHKITSYLEYIRRSHIKSATGRNYVMELLTNRAGVQFFKITYADNNFISRQPLIHRIPFDYDKKVLMTYYSWNYTVGKANYAEFLLKPKKFLCDKSVYNDVYAYAMKLSDDRFTPKYVFDYTVSAFSRIIHNAKNIKNYEPHDAEETADIANVIYMLCYKKKYENGRVNKILINEQTDLRNYADESIWEALKNFVSRKFSLLTRGGGESFYKRILMPKFVQVCCENTKVYTEFSDFCWNHIPQMLEFLDYSYTIKEFDGLPIVDRINQETVLGVTMVKNGNCIEMRQKYLQDEIKRISGGMMTAIIASDLKDPEKHDKRYTGNIVKCDTSVHNVIRNLGDGNCLYYSLLGKDDKTEVKKVKKFLLNANMNDYTDIARSRMTEILSKDGAYGDDNIVDLYAVNYNVRVILHAVGDDKRCSCRVYGPKDMDVQEIHIKHNREHFERMVTPYKFSPIQDEIIETNEDGILDIVERYKTFATEVTEKIFENDFGSLIDDETDRYDDTMFYDADTATEAEEETIKKRKIKKKKLTTNLVKADSDWEFANAKNLVNAQNVREITRDMDISPDKETSNSSRNHEAEDDEIYSDQEYQHDAHDDNEIKNTIVAEMSDDELSQLSQTSSCKEETIFIQKKKDVYHNEDNKGVGTNLMNNIKKLIGRKVTEAKYDLSTRKDSSYNRIIEAMRNNLHRKNIIDINIKPKLMYSLKDIKSEGYYIAFGTKRRNRDINNYIKIQEGETTSYYMRFYYMRNLGAMLVWARDNINGEKTFSLDCNKSINEYIYNTDLNLENIQSGDELYIERAHNEPCEFVRSFKNTYMYKGHKFSVTYVGDDRSDTLKSVLYKKRPVYVYDSSKNLTFHKKNELAKMYHEYTKVKFTRKLEYIDAKEIHLHLIKNEKYQEIHVMMEKLCNTDVVVCDFLVHERAMYRRFHKYLNSLNTVPDRSEKVELLKDFDIIDHLNSRINMMEKEEFINRKTQIYIKYNVNVDKHEILTKGYRKLIEILGKYKFEYTNVLDLCANPGGFTLALKKYNSACSVFMHKYYHESTVDDLLDFSRLKGVTIINAKKEQGYVGDLRSKLQVATLKNLLPRAFDFVVADGCCKGVDSDETYELICAECEVVFDKLVIGGTLVIKLFFQKRYEKIFNEMLANFEECHFYKPQDSNPISSEIYLICKGFRTSTNGKHYYLEDTYSRYKSMLREFVEMELCDVVDDETLILKPIDETGEEASETKEDEETDMPLEKIYENFMKDKKNMKLELDLFEGLSKIISEEELRDVMDSRDYASIEKYFRKNLVREQIDKNVVVEKYDGKKYMLKKLSKIGNNIPLIDKDLYRTWTNTKNEYDPYFENDDGTRKEICMRNACREILEAYRVTPYILRNTLETIYKSYRLKTGVLGKVMRYHMLTACGNYGVYNPKTSSWVLEPKGEKKYHFFFDGKEFVKLSEVDKTNSGLLLVNDECEIMTETLLYDSLKDLNLYTLKEETIIELVTGIPGCGKSTYIATNCKEGDCILSSTKESVGDLKKKLENLGKKRINVRTVHSFLINNQDVYGDVWIDEALMRHYGEIVYVMLKSKCDKLIMIGDVAQIPYFNRTPSFLMNYSRISKFVQPTKHLDKSYRCPADVARMFSSTYPNGFVSTTGVIRSLNCVLINSLADVPKPRYDVKILVFKKIDKQTLNEQGYKNVSTIGETQGCQYDEVIVIRISKVVQDEIFTRKEQILVGTTRHKKKFTYYSVIEDDLFKMIKNSQDTSNVEIEKYMRCGGGYSDQKLMYVEGYRGDYERKTNFLGLVQVSDSIRKIIDGSLGSHHSCVIYRVKEFDNPYEARYEKGFIPDGNYHYEFLQTVYDTILPGNSIHDYKYDQYHCEKIPLEFDYENVLVDLSKFAPPKVKKYNCLRPELRTSMAHDRQAGQIDALVGLSKRNLNIPELDGVVDQKFFVDAVTENFVETFIDSNKMGDFENMANERIYPNDYIVAKWLEEQPEATRNQIVDGKSVYEMILNAYNLTNKPQIKPQLDTKAPYEYSAVQTIASQNKNLNLIFCPIFRELKARLLTMIDKRFMLYCDMSPEEFAKKFSAFHPPALLYGKTRIEIDIGKYDKSQHRLLFEIELKLYRKLGLPEEYVELWRKGHENTVLKDHNSGVTAYVEFQRKSGDASTFFGNTMVLMAVLSTIYDLKNNDSVGVFSGDDSILWVDEYHDRNELCGTLFNLEAKFFKFEESMHFCSKFMVNDGKNWFFVPDPLKILTKLGRHNIVNWDHLEEYRISLNDLCSIYKDGRIYNQLIPAFRERYKTDVDVTGICQAIINVIRTKESFREMFYTNADDVMCTDPSRPVLD